MSKIKIATDSTADIPKSFCEELNISVLPLTILAGEKEYRDGVDIAPYEFYRIIDESKVLPVSSQVASVLYSELFEETWKAGYTDLIQVTLNSKGSGTYQAAVLSRELFYEEHPEAREQLAIHIIDSKTYSMAYGIGVIESAQLVQTGASAQKVIAHIEDWLEHTRPVFIPLNLRCVKKSGRISPAAAFVGDAIGLKPLITFEDGEAKIIGKARGERKAIVFKYTKEGETETALSGAKFTLSKNTDGSKPIALVSEGNNVYRVAKTGETGTVTEITTDANGKFTIQGLDADTYYLTETAAPAGYNKLAAPIKVMIDNNGNVTYATKTTANGEYGNAVAADASLGIKVLNQSGTELPSTGGMGTTIFYVLGSILVVAAVVLLVTKKRMSASDK